MSEKLSQTLDQIKQNPLDALKKITQEKSELKKEVMKGSGLITQFSDYINTTYSTEQVQQATEGLDLTQYIQGKIVGFSTDDVVDMIPGATDVKNMIASVNGLFSSDDDVLGPLLSEFIVLRKTKPLDIQKIETWLTEHDISKPDPVSPSGTTAEVTPSPSVDPLPVAVPENQAPVESLLEPAGAGLSKIVALAKAEIGTNEKDNSADKYFRELGYKHDSKKVPWCGAFVSWTLMKSGFPIPKNDLSAKAFIDESGKGHVGIKVADKIVSGNYGNKVSSDTMDSIDKKIVGYAIPTSSGLEIHKDAVDFDKIPEGAVVVFDRDSKRKQAA